MMTQQGITLWLKDEVKEGDKIKMMMIMRTWTMEDYMNVFFSCTGKTTQVMIKCRLIFLLTEYLEAPLL